MNLAMRPETAADAPVIEAITIAAFHDAPHASHTEQAIVNALRRAGMLTVSLVAEADGKAVGHVAVSPVSISDGSTGWFGLGPVSVVPGHQGGGIGTGLVRAALDALRQQGAAGCVVLGDPAYYGRFGFQARPDLTLPGVPPRYFQCMAFGSAIPHGIVSYHDAFNARSQAAG